ncbi:uncharacterized protein LOC111023598 [Momordica charantia]|uniref:Uncharacterized protein LOC111023598 n=1 Tax=Momordica charantia TaxID=3673 RepID=A0A6J1DST0_MOMCH|nr:uncharacterized protein LOC111023598 [Momordica charantia]
MSCCSSSPLSSKASTFLLYLLLVITSLKILNLTLNLLSNGFNSLPTFIFSLFFKSTPCVLISFIKLPAQALLSAFQQLAQAMRAVLMYTIEMGLGIITSFVLMVLEFLKNAVFGSILESGSIFGGLVEKTKSSFMESSMTDQVREIIESISKKIIDMALETASSFAGSMFDFVKDTILELLNEPSSAIGELVEKMKEALAGSSAMDGVREIVQNFLSKMIGAGSGVASSSASGLFEFVKNALSLAVESGLTVGGLLEKMKESLEVLSMEGLRGIIESISKIILDVIFSYLFG